MRGVWLRESTLCYIGRRKIGYPRVFLVGLGTFQMAFGWRRGPRIGRVLSLASVPGTDLRRSSESVQSWSVTGQTSIYGTMRLLELRRCIGICCAT